MISGYAYSCDVDSKTVGYRFRGREVFCDAVSGSAFLHLVEDKEFDPDLLGKFPKIAFWQKILVHLAVPFYFVLEFGRLLARTVDKNVMYQGKRNTGKKRGATSFELNFQEYLLRLNHLKLCSKKVLHYLSSYEFHQQ